MKLHRLALACFALHALPAMAAITCNVSVTPISTVYSPTITPENISTGSYTVTCTRAAGDPTTLNYDLAAGNGLQPSGVINRVQLGATTNRYNYELYRLAPYTNPNRWQLQNALRFVGSLNFGTGFVATSGAQPFVLRIPPLQTPPRPAGTYTDTVAATLRQDASSIVLATTNFDVTVITDNICEISTPPGAINFSYTSFQATAATASTTFNTRCTTGLPYSVAIDTLPASPASLGLAYSLTLAPVTSPTSPATGNGLPQLFTITGTMPAGQSGSCATATCTATQPRTITITY